MGAEGGEAEGAGAGRGGAGEAEDTGAEGGGAQAGEAEDAGAEGGGAGEAADVGAKEGGAEVEGGGAEEGVGEAGAGADGAEEVKGGSGEACAKGTREAQSFFQSFRLALFTVQETRYAIFAGAFRMSTAVRLSWPKLVMVQRVVVAESSGSRVIYWRVLLFIEFNFFTRYLFLLSEFIQ